MEKLLMLSPEDVRSLERVLEDSNLPEAHYLRQQLRRASPIVDHALSARPAIQYWPNPNSTKTAR